MKKLTLSTAIILIVSVAFSQPKLPPYTGSAFRSLNYMASPIYKIGFPTVIDTAAGMGWTRSYVASHGATYPAAGIPLSTGSAWGTSITNNSSNWNTAYGWGNHASAGYFVGTSSTIRGLFSSTATGLTYTNSTGAFSLTSGYVIPTTGDISSWNTAFLWGNWAASFGTREGDIAQGNDSRINNGQTAYDWTSVYSPRIETNTTSLTTRIGISTGVSENETALRGNIFVGYESGYATTTGGLNTFMGTQSGKSNTTGTENTFTGYISGNKTTTGSKNTFTGMESGYTNTTGEKNSFIGYGSGRYNLDGNNNVFNGYWSGYSNTSGSNNTFLGYESGKANTTGVNNVYLGYNAGKYGTRDSMLIIDGLPRGTDAAQITNSIIYGKFTALPENQWLRINAKLGISKAPVYNLDITGSVNSDSIFVNGVRKDNVWDNKVSSQWVTTGSNIYYNTGYVGIGTTAPDYPLHVKSNDETVIAWKRTGVTDQKEYGFTQNNTYSYYKNITDTINLLSFGKNKSIFIGDDTKKGAVSIVSTSTGVIGSLDVDLPLTGHFGIYDNNGDGGYQMYTNATAKTIIFDPSSLGYKIGVSKTPTHKLDVSGAINTDSIYINGVRKDLVWDAGGVSPWTPTSFGIHYIPEIGQGVGIGSVPDGNIKLRLDEAYALTGGNRTMIGITALYNGNDGYVGDEVMKGADVNISNTGDFQADKLIGINSVVSGGVHQYAGIFHDTVGVNTDAPTYNLDVNGSINGTSYYLNGVLKSNMWHDSTTIGTANGLTRTGKQVLNLGLSNTSTTGALSNTDWNTFNGKVGGTGTANYISKWSGTSTHANSIIQDDGTYVGIGIAPTAPYKLKVNGDIYSGSIISTGQVAAATSVVASAYIGCPFITSRNATGNSIDIFPQDKDAPYIRFGAGNDNVTFTTEWARFTVDKRLGLGLTAPASKLHQDMGTGLATYHQFTAGTTTGQLSTDGTRIGIDASGNSIIKQQEPSKYIDIIKGDTSIIRVKANHDVNISSNLTVTGTILGSNIETNTTSQSVRIGTEAGIVEEETGAKYNVFVGRRSGYSNTSGDKNTFVGGNSGYFNIGGNYNAFFGESAGSINESGHHNAYFGSESGINATGSYNTFIGNYSGFYNETGSNNIFLGSSAGFWETGSNKFYLTNLSGSSLADGKSKSLMYGELSPTVANQSLTVNASNFDVSGQIAFKYDSTTKERALCVLVTASSTIAKGQVLVYIIGGTNNRVSLCPTTGTSHSAPVGVAWNAASDTGDELWMAIQGVVQVLPETGITAVMGNIITTSTTAAGRVEQDSSVPTTKHPDEVGIWTESGSGNGALAKAIIHFN